MRPSTLHLLNTGVGCYHNVFKNGYSLQVQGHVGLYYVKSNGLDGVRSVTRGHVCFRGCSKDHSPTSNDGDARNWECPWYRAALADASSNGVTTIVQINAHVTKPMGNTSNKRTTLSQAMMQCPGHSSYGNNLVSLGGTHVCSRVRRNHLIRCVHHMLYG